MYNMKPTPNACLYIRIGIGTWVDKMEMQVISSYPASSNFIHVDSFDELGRMVEQIADIICDSKNTLP